MNLFKYIAVFSILILSQSAFADGVFMVVKGDVKVAAKGKAPAPARVGMKVAQSDKIIAGKDARAKIVMVDKNVLNISPNSEIVIESYKTGEGDKNVSLNVLYGKVRATVNQKYDGDKNKFQVKTPSAVAGVRGTDFLTSYTPSTNASKIVTFEGSVTVGSGLSASGAIQNPVTVPAGTFSVASTTAPPTPAAPVPAAELQAMNRETNSDGGARPDPARVPAQTAPEKKEEKTEPKQESKSEPKSEPKGTAAPAPKPGSPGPANSSPGSSASNNSPGERSPASAGPGGPAPMAPPPSMISIGAEVGSAAPVIPTIPDLPPALTDIYRPPEVPVDLIQQNTNLTVNVNVQ